MASKKCLFRQILEKKGEWGPDGLCAGSNERSGSVPWPGHCVVFLGKTLSVPLSAQEYKQVLVNCVSQGYDKFDTYDTFFLFFFGGGGGGVG